jgi:hypothetical protein
MWITSNYQKLNSHKQFSQRVTFLAKKLESADEEK